MIPNEAKLVHLNLILADEANWDIGLYKNDITPGHSTEFTDLTECDFSGYSRAAVANMSAPTIESNEAVSEGDEEEFTRSGGETSNDVYGTFIVNGDDKLITVYRFPDAPRAMTTEGQVIKITPRLTLGNKPAEE